MSDSSAPESAKKNIRCFVFGQTPGQGTWQAPRQAAPPNIEAQKEQENVFRAQYDLISVADARRCSTPHPRLGPECMLTEASRVLSRAGASPVVGGARVGVKRTYVGQVADSSLFFGFIPGRSFSTTGQCLAAERQRNRFRVQTMLHGEVVDNPK